MSDFTRAGQTDNNRSLTETSGPTRLIVGDIADGEVLKRVGDTIVGGSAGASGTVTSVGLTMPSAVFDVANSPVTGSGTLAVTLDTQTANYVWAGPTTGSAAAPTFRALVAADIPAPAALTASVLTLGTTSEFTNERVATAGQGVTITDAGAGSTATFTASGVNTNGFLFKRTQSPLITPTLVGGEAIHTYFMDYVSAQDKCYFTTGNVAGGGTIGKLCYMERTSDTPVVLQRYTPTVKKPGAFVYDPVSTRLYINNLATGAVFSASASTGAVITSPITINGAGGMVIRPTDGKIYCWGTGALFSLDPVSDTVSSSLGSANSTNPGTEHAMCYAGGSFDALYVIMTNGKMQRYSFAASAWQTAMTAFSSAASGGSVVYDDVTDKVYGACVNDTAGIKVIDPSSPDAVASTIAYPLGLTGQNAQGSGEMIKFGRHLMLAMHGATTPGTVLVFSLDSQAFVAALIAGPNGTSFAGRFMGGVVNEGVLYVASGSAGAGNSQYCVFGR